MKQYKHPTATRFRAKPNYTGTNYILSVVLCMGTEEKFDVSEQELLALGFEEVVEKEKDWIDECVHDIFEYQRGRPKEDETDTVSVRRIIETHIPKQKKFTGNDVHEHSMKTYGSDSGFYVNFTLNFLRDHDLLEE